MKKIKNNGKVELAAAGALGTAAAGGAIAPLLVTCASGGCAVALGVAAAASAAAPVVAAGAIVLAGIGAYRRLSRKKK